MRGSMLRARRDWLGQGEKMSKYYFNLECKSYKRRNRYKIRANDRVITGTKNVLQEQYKFYENLYSEHNEFSKEKFDTFTGKLDCSKVKDEHMRELDKNFTLVELRRAIYSAKKNTVPGSDGLCNEFYQKFFPEIGQLLVDVCNIAIKQGLHTTAKQGVITLIEKSGKNLDFLENWRPLSLQNCDGKLYSKMIAERLQLVVPYLIHSDQSGFLKGRSINEKLMDLTAVIEYANKENIPGLIISFNFRKAFDTLNWKYLDAVLEKFGFSKKFRNMIDSVNKGTTCCTINGGHSSKYMELGRGLRQGSPLSPVLFDLAVEMLGCAIRKNKDIIGIQVRNSRSKKHAQYADDLWAAISAKQEVYDALLRTFKEFGIISGLEVNFHKSQVLRIGSLKRLEHAVRSGRINGMEQGDKCFRCNIHGRQG